MITTLVTAFLLAHGLLHFAIWLPHPDPDSDKSPPFAPDHSAVLAKTSVPQSTARGLSVTLAVSAGVGFVLTSLAVAVDAAWAVPMAVLASLLGLGLKALFFNPWLLIGILLDLGVLVGAATWPWA
jgi:hypothetical protein